MAPSPFSPTSNSPASDESGGPNSGVPKVNGSSLRGRDGRDDRLNPIAFMRALGTMLMSRLSLASRAGMSHEGKRKMWEVFGYPQALTSEDMYIMYKRQDLAKTVVNAPADALWTNPPSITGSDKFEIAWDSLARRFPIWDTLNRADKMTGWSRFSVIIIGLNG